ncbi:EIF3A, partial [Symbiodinium sp. KB8]
IDPEALDPPAHGNIDFIPLLKKGAALQLIAADSLRKEAEPSAQDASNVVQAPATLLASDVSSMDAVHRQGLRLRTASLESEESPTTDLVAEAAEPSSTLRASATLRRQCDPSTRAASGCWLFAGSDPQLRLPSHLQHCNSMDTTNTARSPTSSGEMFAPSLSALAGAGEAQIYAAGALVQQSSGRMKLSVRADYSSVQPLIRDEALDPPGAPEPLERRIQGHDDVQPSILFEQGDVFVVHKPPGWNVSVSFDELDQKKGRCAQAELHDGRVAGRSVLWDVELGGERKEGSRGPRSARPKQNLCPAMTPHQIILLCSLALPAWAGINIPAHERQCDGATWVCRIVCSQGMLGGKGQKANWCVAKHCTRQKAVAANMIAAGQDYCSKNTCFIQETEAIGLLQRPQQGRLALTQVNATTDCLDEKAVCGKFCDGLNSPKDFCMPKCLDNVHVIADALKEYCDECGSPPDYTTTTEKEYKTTTEKTTTTEDTPAYPPKKDDDDDTDDKKNDDKDGRRRRKHD